MKNKNLLLALATFCLVIAVLLGVWYITRPDPQAGMKHITVEVNHGDGSVNSFTYDTDAEYLGAFLLKEGLIAGPQDQYGTFVTTVDGEEAIYEENGSWWSLSCNGEDAQTGVDSVIIEDGAAYAWTYTIG